MVPEMVDRLLAALVSTARESLPCGIAIASIEAIDDDIDADTMARSILGSLASTQRMAK